jgi:hypothetical protein
MRTGIFLIFLALTGVADAINNLAGKTIESIPKDALTFLAILFWLMIIMDIIEFFKKLSK